MLLAAASNTVLKSGIALTVGRARFGGAYAAVSAVALAAGVAAWLLAPAGLSLPLPSASP